MKLVTLERVVPLDNSATAPRLTGSADAWDRNTTFRTPAASSTRRIRWSSSRSTLT